MMAIAEAIAIAEARKMGAHNAYCRAIGVSFIPIVAESLGGWSAENRPFGWSETRTPPAIAVKHLFQRRSILLWKGNAALWALRLPLHSAWVDGSI